MTKDEQFLAGRLLDMAERTYHTDRPQFTDFLNLNEQNVFLSIVNKLPPINFKLVGGYIYSERKIVEFTSQEYDSSDIISPLTVIRCTPINLKFADELTHRDYLGAIMNLGVNRNTLGDFIINEHECYIICLKNISDFICQNLTKVKHTIIRTEIDSLSSIQAIKPNLIEKTGFIASNRIDSIIAMAFNLSRGAAVECISQGNVFVNSKQIVSHSLELKNSDIISVRGTGRFIFNEIITTTKKNRLMISISRY